MKDIITDSFIKLWEERDYKDITVTMICSAVPISRTAFYRYFKDKKSIVRYFVLRDYEANCFPVFRFHLKERGTRYFFSHISDQKKIYLKIYEIDDGMLLFQSLIAAYRVGFERRKEYSNPTNWVDRTFDPEIFFEYACTGIASVILYWIRNGMKPSEDRMAKNLYIMISESLEKVRDHYT